MGLLTDRVPKIVFSGTRKSYVELCYKTSNLETHFFIDFPEPEDFG